MTGALQSLFAYLDSLNERPPLDELKQHIAGLDIAIADVADFVRFSDQAYRRNLVRAGDWYNVWVMCWKNGQRSPIHDHPNSACVVRVLRGTLTETRFVFAPNDDVKAVDSRDLESGGICATHDDDLHQVSNLQADSADLVTLHVYVPPLLRMNTFRLTSPERGEDIWLEERQVLTAGPENSETPLASLRGWVTPNRLFFVRNHFRAPALDRSGYRLRIEGCVDRPLELSWTDLTAMAQRSLFATMECAGNCRSFLKIPAPGEQWGTGAIGHAEWTGVPLVNVLERAGMRWGAIEVVCEGADRGSEPDHPDEMPYARSLPLGKALDPDTLLAFRMNGELLDPWHGYPLRLIVPGWYGVASVKWLTRIEVRDRPFHGYYQTRTYIYQRQTADGVESVSVGPMAVKSEILHPLAGATLAPGEQRVFGLAWAGEETVAAVDVSTDGGRSWSGARLIGPRLPYCWTRWEFPWSPAEPGEYTILARAASSSGDVQPSEHDPLCGGYRIRHSRPIPVSVGAAVAFRRAA
jgi:DMSO/TMAO reductase YedYZ molybdopterin-dependent catalytic subunit